LWLHSSNNCKIRENFVELFFLKANRLSLSENFDRTVSCSHLTFFKRNNIFLGPSVSPKANHQAKSSLSKLVCLFEVQSNLRQRPPMGPQKSGAVNRWPFFETRLFNICAKWDLKMVVVLDRWPLFGGGSKFRFDCMLKR
jgi:hypothetical protein